MMMPEVAHREDRIMKARVAFQYAVGAPAVTPGPPLPSVVKAAASESGNALPLSISLL